MKPRERFSRPAELAIGVLLLVAAALSVNGYLRGPASALRVSRFGDSAREYLQTSSDRSVRFLVALSAAKTGLAVIEGSSADISMVFVGASIQLGDIVKALYDAVDYAWTAVLFGSAMLFALRLLLDAGFHVGEYTFAAAAIALAAAFLSWGRVAESPPFQTATRRLFQYAATITAVVWIAFPLGLILADATSSVVTAPRLEEAEKEVVSLRQVTTAMDESVPPDDGNPMTELKARARRTATTWANLPAYVAAKTDDVTRALGTIIAGYTLDCVVFPAVFSAVLLGFARRMIGLG